MRSSGREEREEEEVEKKVKKKVHPGLIEADKEECAIVVHYETSEAGSTARESHTRRLRLKTLNERSDPAKLADDVLRKCKYIPSSKRRVVELLIANLQEHCAANPDALADGEAAQEARGTAVRSQEWIQGIPYWNF